MIDACQIAEKLEAFAKSVGLSVETSGSNLSSSRYLTISSEDETIKVRVSDHDAKPTYEVLNGAADYEIGPHDQAATIHWPVAAMWLADRFGKQPQADIAKEAAAILEAEAAERAAWRERDLAEAAKRSASRAAKEAALITASADHRAPRLAELQNQLNNPDVTGNRRKRIHAKIRKLISK